MTLVYNLLILFATFNPVKKEDKFFAKDKALHVIHSAAIVGLSYHVYHCQLKNPDNGAKVFSISISAAAGIWKEIYDGVSKKGTPSWKDLIADGVGILLGVLLFTGGG